MIDVAEVMRNMPDMTTFVSVARLHALVEELRFEPARFKVDVAGYSVNGVPIHHVRCGRGSIKALLVAGPHCNEPIGSLNVFSLMTVLQQGSRTLLDADIEWHIVPCIDPDGALLNEGWTQRPFSLAHYMRNNYLQAHRDQVDMSFPVAHKSLLWKEPSQEAAVLKRLLDEIRPDFYFPLHNAWTGGAFYYLTRDIGQEHYREIYRHLERQGLPIQKRPIWKEVCAQFADGITELMTVKKYYDYMEQRVSPDKIAVFGAGSWEYLSEIKPEALTFIAEMGYVRHPGDESPLAVGQNLRQFKLAREADSKHLASLMLEEWDRVAGDLDTASPFYRAIVRGCAALPEKEKLSEGGPPISRYPTRDILFNPQFNKPMTEAERFNECFVDGGFMFYAVSYQFVRLLKGSRQSPAVRSAVERLESEFDSALATLGRYVDFDAFHAIDCNTLARVQLGSGLIVLNSLLSRA